MKYNFKNIADGNADLYLYGAITDDKSTDMFATEADIDLKEFKQVMDGVTGRLNIYINSVGGSVFTASAMASLIQRAISNGVKVTAYIDGLCASASTFLAMVADEIKVYNNSVLMVHKPMGGVFGNATDMKKMINTLDTIEESMLNLYEAKAKVDRAKIKSLVDKESWLDASEVEQYFNVTRINANNRVTACADLDKCGYTVPEHIKAKLQVEEAPQPTVEAVDYSDFENILKSIKGESK